jgi:hypothetical protein
MGSMRIAMGKFAKDGVPMRDGLDKTIETIQKLGPGAEATSLAMETFGARAGPDMAAAILEGRFEVGALLDDLASSTDTIGQAAADTLRSSLSPRSRTAASSGSRASSLIGAGASGRVGGGPRPARRAGAPSAACRAPALARRAPQHRASRRSGGARGTRARSLPRRRPRAGRGGRPLARAVAGGRSSRARRAQHPPEQAECQAMIDDMREGVAEGGAERVPVPRLLDDVAAAAERVRALQDEQRAAMREARAELRARVVAAHSEGVPLAVIARAAGLSRERVRQIAGGN